MRISRTRVRKEEERVLPLVNVVFLLLIFFMLAGELASRDGLDILPPVSTSEASAGPRDLVIQMAPDGAIVLGGEPVEEAALADALRTRIEEGAVGKVYLHADAGLPAVRIVAVLERAKAAGLGEVRLLTLTDTAR